MTKTKKYFILAQEGDNPFRLIVKYKLYSNIYDAFRDLQKYRKIVGKDTNRIFKIEHRLFDDPFSKESHVFKESH